MECEREAESAKKETNTLVAPNKLWCFGGRWTHLLSITVDLQVGFGPKVSATCLCQIGRVRLKSNFAKTINYQSPHKFQLTSALFDNAEIGLVDEKFCAHCVEKKFFQELTKQQLAHEMSCKLFPVDVFRGVGIPRRFIEQKVKRPSKMIIVHIATTRKSSRKAQVANY